MEMLRRFLMNPGNAGGRGIAFLLLTAMILLPSYTPAGAAEAEIPLGPAYRGSKCVISVADFPVQVVGAPQEIGDGLREMLKTALFESNYFLVADRSDPAGISAEQLLSDSILADADALLAQGRMAPAETIIYGAVTALEASGSGMRVKLPGIPLKVGGAYHKALVAIELQVVDSATGKVVAAESVEGKALSGRGSVGASITDVILPMELNMVRNTPLELAIRDCIYRAVIGLIGAIPKSYFRHSAD